MQPLVDGDVLIHECSVIGEKWENGELREILDVDFCIEVLNERLRQITEAVAGDETPIIFLTGDAKLLGEEYKRNFRFDTAKDRPYKGNRTQPKPYHYYNLRAYVLSKYDCKIANGCEADDEICIEQYSRLEQQNSIICTRDKDLRQCPGWHYGWEVGKQGEFGPKFYSAFGEIQLKRSTSGNKIIGGGFKFFATQLLTGDVVDNIGGLQGWGPIKTYDLIAPCEDERACIHAIRHAYSEVFPEHWKDRIREQSDLIWIVKERNPDGSLKMFNPKDYLNA